MSPSPLHALPFETIDAIAFHLAALHPHAPLRAIRPLQATCSRIRSALSSPALHAKIFRTHFDHSAVARRAFFPTSSNYTDQLELYTYTLRVLAAADIYHPNVESVLFTAFIMMLENDGRNRHQLEHVRLPAFVDAFVRARLHENSHNGWPAEDTASACALWLMWMTTTQERLLAESESQRQSLIRLILPYVLLPYRYPTAFAPPHHFHLPLPSARRSTNAVFTSVPTAHGPYPIYPSSTRAWSQINYSVRLSMVPPLASTAAKLVYFSRREVVPFGIPPHLPQTRADAIAAGNFEIGPTQEDMREFNRYSDTRLPARTGWDDPAATGEHPIPKHLDPPSRAWDCDWERLTTCSDAWSAGSARGERWGKTYIPGTLAGLWQGRVLIPSETHLAALASTSTCPPDFSESTLGVITQPVYMRIHEHHCLHSQGAGAVIPSGAPTAPPPPVDLGHSHTTADPTQIAALTHDDGLRNAWFPGAASGAVRFRADGAAVDVGVPELGPGAAWRYHTHDPSGEGVRAHEADGCEGCAERARIMARAGREGWGDVFDEAGFGAGAVDEDGDMDMEEDAEDWEASDAGSSVGCQTCEMEVDDNDGDGDGEDSRPAHLPPPHRAPLPPCSGIRDIIFTGATDARHGQAWNHYDFYGRVRAWDGLVGVLRRPRDGRMGHVFFYGYVCGEGNFVGNWRVAGVEGGGVAWEGAFTMSRREGE